MGSSWRIMKIGGIPISVDPGWLIAVFIISWSLSGTYLPDRLPGLSSEAYWLFGVLGALFLFASVLAHELGHALTALRFSVRVEGITLFLFGGVARLKEEPKRARDEFVIAAAGPLVSIVVTGLAAVIASVATGAVGALAYYLAFTNGLLVAFNLIPGFPLDGGRMLRAAAWGVTGSLDRATTLATLLGQGFALILIVFGFAQLINSQIAVGLWSGFIGWYLFGAASSSQAANQTSIGLRGIRVADIMDVSPPVVSPTLTLEHFVQDYVIREGLRAAVVVVGDKPWGIVSLTDVRKMPSAEWATTAVAEIATRPPLVTVTPSATAEHAMSLLAQRSINQIVVLDESERLVGMVTRAAIINLLQLRREAPALWARKTARQT
jgi:Zn-dependent protease/CBS domain-containing protein